MRLFKNKKRNFKKLTETTFGGQFSAEFSAVHRVLTHVRRERAWASRELESAVGKENKNQILGQIQAYRNLEKWLVEYSNELLNL